MLRKECLLIAAGVSVLLFAGYTGGAKTSSNASGPNAKTRKVAEYINPGFAKMPVHGDGDWFKAGNPNAKHPSLRQVHSEVKYTFLTRKNADKEVAPSQIFVQPQSLWPSGKIVNGYSFKYSDRIQLKVDPTDRPLDIDYFLTEKITPNTRGERLVWHKTEVRGLPAMASEAGVQKWKSGQVNKYPAIVTWTEKGNGEAPYLLYALMSDGPVDQLKAMAAKLEKDR